MHNVAVIITCPYCGVDQSIEIHDLPSANEVESLPHRMDGSTVCAHCEALITFHMTIQQRSMFDGHYFGQIPGGPVFPGMWFGTS